MHVSDFGWIPGIVDMAAAQAAVDAAMATGETLYFDAGEYLLDVNPDTDGVIVARQEGANLTMQGATTGLTVLRMVPQNEQKNMIYAVGLDRFELNGFEIDGNRTYITLGPGSSISAHRVNETHYYNLDIHDAGPLRAISEPNGRAQLLSFGDLHFADIQGAAALFTKKNGVETIVQTGPVTVERGSGGLTLDSDPRYFNTGPAVIDLSNEIGSSLVTVTWDQVPKRDIGDWIEIKNADQRGYNGRFQVLEKDGNTLLIDVGLTLPTAQATGAPAGTYAWGPNQNITIGSLTLTDGFSTGTLAQTVPRGQVRGVKLEDGIGHVVIGTITAIDLYATTTPSEDRSGALLIGAGASDLGVESIDAETVIARNVGDGVQIEMGRRDMGFIDFETLDVTDARTALKIVSKFDYSAYREGHGTIDTLRIGHLIGHQLENALLVSTEGGPILGPVIDTLIIEHSTLSDISGRAFSFLPGSFKTLIGGDFTDDFNGSDGDETIMGRGGDDILLGLRGHDALWGEDGDDLLSGGAGRDWLHGGAGNDTLWGGASHDTLIGAEGDDLLVGGLKHDTLIGVKGDDHLIGGHGHDSLYGGGGADTLVEGQGDGLLHGGAGADTLTGGQGNDVLTGGLASDHFIFASGDGDDVITDLVAGEIIEIVTDGPVRVVGHVIDYDGGTITLPDADIAYTLLILPDLPH